jgi:hypothetical protein
MNAKIFGEGVLVVTALFGIGMATSSGFSNAGDATTSVRESAPGAYVSTMPETAPGTNPAVAYSASGEGVFLANGDLVGGR